MAAALDAGEASLSASIQQLCKRIDSREIRDIFGPKKLDKSLLKKFKLTLLTLDAVLDDAHQKEFEIPSVGNWLDELREAVCDAGVLLDDIDAEVFGLKMAAEDHSVVTQVWNFLSVPFSRFDQRMKDKIKELYHRLKFLGNEKDVLGLRKGVRKVSQMPTTCLVDKSFVVGRDGDKEEVTRLLISDAESRNNVSVITIVGMAGIGKTTLAQLVYNDQRVKEHFDIQAWVCVSEDFDAVRVTKTLLESITSTVCDITDLNFVQVQLKHEVRGKRFLFVLDDLWNENYHDWNLLQVPFLYAAGGSKVVITTRSETVASIVRNVPTHYLEPLSDEDCWSLILKHALGDSYTAEHSNIRETDKETAIRKCNGLPLIARALGGLLRGKTSGSEEWHHLLHTNIWEVPSIARILPTCLLQQLRQKGRESHQKRRSARTEANSAEWIFLVTSLCMEILSAAFDQASSPRRPRYALFGMLLAIAALLTCIWELIYKGRKNNVVWRKRGCYMLFGSANEIFGLLGGIAQCVCSIVQYFYYIRRANNPLKLSLLPAIFLICLIAARLSRKRMQTPDETREHTA
ncbi:putative disease resistance RPP13-like protein 1 [Pyrus communis]|uniref:putative disease resistance RPP13-like protein 1 n=1 Tax=Pyrus communis TaxID=23211 RepID=UPI0035C1392C